MDFKSLLKIIFFTIYVFPLISGEESNNTFEAKPEKCNIPVPEVDPIIEQVFECSTTKWEPLETNTSETKERGLFKIHLLPNGTSVRDVVSGLVSTNLSDPVPLLLKKLIPKSIRNRSRILTRSRGRKEVEELKLNERVCCLLFENICVRNKVYRINCKMNNDFSEEVEGMYDKLLKSCADINLDISETYCGEQIHKPYDNNTTCDQYLPCSRTEELPPFVDKNDGPTPPMNRSNKSYICLHFILILLKFVLN